MPSRNTIYIIAILVAIAALVWYVMRAQRQAATINGAAATGTTPTTGASA